MYPRIPISKFLINRRNTNHNQPDAKLHICCHNNCGQSFTTYNKLLVHKNRTGHKKNRKHKAEESKESGNKEVKKRSTDKKNADEFLQQKSGHRGGNLREEEPEKKFEEEDEKEERCEADGCKIDNCENDNVQWVSCNICRSWWHLFCLYLSTTPKKSTCPKCWLNSEVKSGFFWRFYYVVYCVLLCFYCTCNLENKKKTLLNFGKLGMPIIL